MVFDPPTAASHPPGNPASPRGTSKFRIRFRKAGDRKSTRLNSNHLVISYAVFCLKKKKIEMRALEVDVGDQERAVEAGARDRSVAVHRRPSRRVPTPFSDQLTVEPVRVPDPSRID